MYRLNKPLSGLGPSARSSMHKHKIETKLINQIQVLETTYIAPIAIESGEMFN